MFYFKNLRLYTELDCISSQRYTHISLLLLRNLRHKSLAFHGRPQVR